MFVDNLQFSLELQTYHANSIIISSKKESVKPMPKINIQIINKRNCNIIEPNKRIIGFTVCQKNEIQVRV